MTDKQLFKLALDALEANYLLVNGTETHGGLEQCLDGYYSSCFDTDPINKQTEEAITALKARLADPMREVQRLGQEIEQDHTYGYASRLAVAIWQKHYMKDAPKWKPLDTTEGVLTQIDNMTCGLVKEKLAQPEQEPKLPEIFCGVDYADGVLSVSVMRRRPDDVAELLHSEQIELEQPAETSAERTLRTLGYTNNGGEFWKPPLGAWPPQRTEQEPVELPCCGYTDASAVKWNPFNGVVQCHNCGQCYTTPPQRTEPTCPECKAVVLYECVACSSNNYPPKETT